MKELEEDKKILDIHISINWSFDKLFIIQSSYINKILHMFNMQNTMLVSTQLAWNFQLSSELST